MFILEFIVNNKKKKKKWPQQLKKKILQPRGTICDELSLRPFSINRVENVDM